LTPPIAPASGPSSGGPIIEAVAHSRPPIPDAIARTGVIAIGRRLAPGDVLPVAAALIRGGVEAFEITMGSEGDAALDAIESLSRDLGRDGRLLVGAGTVLEPRSAERAVAAGARFVVMPHLDESLVRWATEHEVPVFPGAFTPTEILAAWRAGASAVKLFPASVAGPAFVRELRGPFPDIPLIPTGGVSVESAEEFVAAGAVAIGLGSWLMAGRDVTLVESRARSAVEAVARARSGVRL
jgi:2-dehydro-3-deoxyphosphogluconate aldolase/(4S)-4-hydroxy-2-oxoglutarate aldolase